MNINQVKYFVAIVKHGSFFEAAMEEYISQSSLSKQIKSLESELGVELFNRERNKIKLTEAGNVFLSYAQQMLSLDEEIFEAMNQYKISPDENINFASIPIITSYNVSRLLADFQNGLPVNNSIVNYNIMELEQKEIIPLLRTGKIDFAFLRHCNLPENKYEMRLFATDEIGLICNKDHPLAQRKVIDINDLTNEHILMISPKSEIYHICMSELAKYGKEKNVVATTTRHRNLLTMVRDKAGITFFAKKMVENMEFTDLRFIPLAQPIYSNIYIIKQKDKKLNKMCNKLWRYLCNRFPEYKW